MSEAAEDAGVHDAVLATLHVTGVLPVLPLIEIIIRYALPFRSVVTTVGPGPDNSQIVRPRGVSVWRHPKRAGARILVADSYPAHISVMSHDAAGSVSFERIPLLPATAWESISAHGMCVDPTNPNRIYVIDSTRASVFDATAIVESGDAASGVCTILAGGDENGFADGTGTKARFHGLCGVVCTNDGGTLIVADSRNNRLRQIDTKTGDVTTLAGDGESANHSGRGTNAGVYQPDAICFAASLEPPDSTVYTAAIRCIMQCDRRTGDTYAVKTPAFPNMPCPYGLASLPNGQILISAPHAVFMLDPMSGELELIAGAGSGGDARGYENGSALAAKFRAPYGIALDEVDRSLLVSDTANGCIRRVTLPPEYFDPPSG